MFTLQDLTRVGLSMGIRADGFDDFIESINHQGYILKKGPRLYQVQSSSANSQRTGGGGFL
jgi:DNA helicase MCM8